MTAAIKIYDSSIKTGNKVLDTIMTEKSGNEKLSTDILFQEIEKRGTVNRENIHFVEQKEILLELYNRIAAIPASINKFAGMCNIYPSHLHDFLRISAATNLSLSVLC